MSGLELNKIAAAVLLGGLIAMLAGTFSTWIYPDDYDPEKRGFQIAVSDDTSSTGAKVEEKVDLIALLTAADPAAGKKVAKKCLACHTFDKGGANKVGPNLWNILGDKFAHTDDFQYSEAFYSLNGGWDYENLYEFLNNPKKYVKGTKMAFAGIKKPKDLANIIYYMRSLSDKPLPLPK